MVSMIAVHAFVDMIGFVYLLIVMDGFHVSCTRVLNKVKRQKNSIEQQFKKLDNVVYYQTNCVNIC